MKLKILVVAVVFFTSGGYLYHRGLQDGEQRYKQSRRMYFALKSAYHYGYMDGKEGKHESWDGPDLDVHPTLDLTSEVCIANVTEQDIQYLVSRSGYTVTGLPHQPRWVTLEGKECK